MSQGSAVRFSQNVLNIAASGAGNVIAAGAGLLTIPFLVLQFGAEAYGVWAVVALLTGYIVLLDVGVTIATGRMLAARRAKGDAAGMGDVIASALVIYVAIVLSCLALGYALSVHVADLFNIPDHLARDAGASIMISAIGVAIYFAFSIFTSLLWAHERLDVISGLEIVVQIGRAVATFILIRPGSSIVEVATITAVGHVALGCMSVVVCGLLIRPATLRPGRLSIALIRKLLRLGIDFFAVNVGRILPTLVGATVISRELDLASVAAFSVARQLVTYANGFMAAVTQAAAARAVAYHAAGQRDRQTRLMSTGAVLTSACAFFIVGGYVLLGFAFMQLWQGGRLENAYAVLAILALGEALPMSQWVTNGVVLGMERQLRIAWLFFLEAIGGLVGAMLVVDTFGLLGVAAALAVNAALFRGVLQWLVGIRLIGLQAGRYAACVFLPLAAITVLSVVALHWSGLTAGLTTWTNFAGATLVYAAAYWSAFGLATKMKAIREPA